MNDSYFLSPAITTVTPCICIYAAYKLSVTHMFALNKSPEHFCIYSPLKPKWDCSIGEKMYVCDFLARESSSVGSFGSGLPEQMI